MLNRIIRFSLANRAVVLWLAGAVALLGVVVLQRLDVDVFPDLNRPTVTIFAEAPGLATEEVESMVEFPIETAINGATNVERVRSVSTAGLGLSFVEFAWGSDIYVDRQVVTERLQVANTRLPSGVVPVLGPISSLMGEILLVGLQSDTGTTAAPDIRSLADWVIRPRLLAVPGVSQVTAIGGGVKQLQVLVQPDKLQQYKLSLHDVESAVAQSNLNTTGGYLQSGRQEFLVRNIGRIRSLDDLRASTVAWRGGVPVFLKDLSRTVEGVQVMRGDAGIDGRPAVIISVQKQPGTDTVKLTRAVNQALDELATSLPPDVKIDRQVFRQADFITAAITNLERAVRDGSIIVAVVLILFLLNVRTTVITLTAIPLSLFVTAIVMAMFGISVNTMTLGGVAVAIGQLVDDAIVDVENVQRRLKENRRSPDPRPPIDVVLDASSEIRNSITYGTVVVILAFLPLFFLSDIEGRMFVPLGIAYVVSILASLAVSLTVTPVLCSYLLPRAGALARAGDSPLVGWLKRQDTRLLRVSLQRPWTVIGAACGAFLVAAALCSVMGREFLPPFNEGTITVNVLAQPGISLGASNAIGAPVERLLLQIPDVLATGRRTGRAELDEHAEGVHYTEIEVRLRPGAREREAIMGDIRRALAAVPGVDLNIGQPISHRLDHLLSGTDAQIAVKVFGRDLDVLIRKAAEIEAQMKNVRGIVDVSTEKQTRIPQVRVEIDREAAAQYGLRVGEINETLETALNGRVVSQAIDGERRFDILVRLDDPYRTSIRQFTDVLIDGPLGTKVPLGAVARVTTAAGPNQILRENAQRRLVVQANVAGRDLGSTVDDLRRVIAEKVRLDPGYFVTYGGQFESQQRATRLLVLLSALAVAGVFVVLSSHFRSAALALQIMANIPLAIIGGAVAVFLSGRTLSIASLIGFITLAGIAARNGIMMISHYLHLVKYEGERFDEQMIIRGSLERLVPVLMTALTGSLGVLPLVLASHSAGAELLHPVAVVILGGLITSTLLDQAVTPALFHRLGRSACERVTGTGSRGRELLHHGAGIA